MPILADKARAQFRLAGDDIAPAGVLFAPSRDRRMFWRFVAKAAHEEKIAEIRRSVDVEGQALTPRSRVRRDRARGPVLIPHHNDSRFITQLRWEGTDSGAVVWWRFPWGRIVGYWAQGIRYRNRLLPVRRDVVGLTAEGLARVRARAAKFWAAFVAKGRPAEAERGPGFRLVEGGDGALSTGWRKPPPRPRDSIFAPPPFPRSRPVVVAARRPKGRLAPWELQRLTSELMDAAARRAVTESEIEAWVESVRGTQTLDAVRDVLRRLGVSGPIPDWAAAVELLRLQALERLRGRFPGVWTRRGPAGPGGPAPVRGRGPGPIRPRRAAVAVGAGAAAIGGLLAWWLSE